MADRLPKHWNACAYCGAPCRGRTCNAHADLKLLDPALSPLVDKPEAGESPTVDALVEKQPDGCVTCHGELPPIAMKHADKFCSSRCARIAHECALDERSGPEKLRGRVRDPMLRP